MISNKSIIAILFLSLFSLSSIANEPDKDCVEWFNRAKISVGSKDCELRCVTLNTNMSTFICPDQCNSLCRTKSNPFEKLIYYPGLTLAEKDLLQKYPGDGLIVYFQMREAEKSTIKNFPDQNLNDESDAFRHFIWAGLLTKELGREKAKKFLDAHEEDPNQPQREQQMDIHNNNKGQFIAESLIQSKNWSIKNLEFQALRALREKDLQILKPGLLIPKEPK